MLPQALVVSRIAESRLFTIVSITIMNVKLVTPGVGKALSVAVITIEYVPIVAKLPTARSTIFAVFPGVLESNCKLLKPPLEYVKFVI